MSNILVGGGPSPGVKTPGCYFFFLFALIFSSVSRAEPEITVQELPVIDDSYISQPYVPQEADYSVEFGAMWEEKNLYWTGVDASYHVGRCLFTQSQTCQQYLGLIGGVAGRDGQTHGLFLSSLRWQFVNFPSSWSPMLRVFAGGIHSAREFKDEWNIVYGAGYGVNFYLHKRVDVRIESRIGYDGQLFGQMMMAVHFKLDRWVEYFAERLRDLGVGAIKATGEAVKTTGKGIGTVIKYSGKGLKKAGEAVTKPLVGDPASTAKKAKAKEKAE